MDSIDDKKITVNKIWSYTSRRKRQRGFGNNFEPINVIAERFVNQLPGANRYRDISLVKKIWQDISGDFIYSNTAVTSLKDGVLVITAASSPFLFHLRSAKKSYIEQINKRVNNALVTEIFYKIGSLKRPEEKKTMFDEIRDYAKDNQVMFYEIENIEIPDEVLSSINDFTASLKISDAELCEKITGAAKVIYKVTQYKKRNGYIECAMCASLYYKRTYDCGGAAGNEYNYYGADTCEYCRFKLAKMMSGAVKMVLEYPWDDYESHAAKCPDTKFKEFEYIKKREFCRVKTEVEVLIKKFIMSESAETFEELNLKIRLALSLYESYNYFEVKEFGQTRLDLMAAVLGPNARAVYARGAMAVKF
jgi:hypothetical protein